MRATLSRLLHGRPDPSVQRGYACVLAQARRPEFYLDCCVPDTLDGRFDLLALHAFLVLHRLRGQGPAADSWCRRLLEAMVTALDRGLREDADDRALHVALENNLYGTVLEPPSHAIWQMATYMRTASDHLSRQPVADLTAGRVGFPDPRRIAGWRESSPGTTEPDR